MKVQIIMAIVGFILGFISAEMSNKIAENDEKEWEHYGPADLFDNEECEKPE